jgi:cephalosporin hydroxylase
MSNINEVRGWFNYEGITTMQHSDVLKPLEILINDIQPKRLLEIGTASGGLTLILRDILDKLQFNECTLRTYDINPDFDRCILQDNIANGKNIDFRLKNLFNHPYSDLDPANEQEVKDYIKTEGPTIVLCDGGSKINEFNILSKFLKPGDIIMAHDYSPTMDYFETYNKDKIWNWCELFDEDVSEACDNYNLQPYMSDDFTKVVWLCKIKK